MRHATQGGERPIPCRALARALACVASLALAHAHVPTYGGGTCHAPPHQHDISQVLYFKGSGGLEIHVKTDSKPFDTLGGEIIDVDVVFRDKPDPLTYDLYIGCGGCAPEDALVPTSEQPVLGYETPVLEPFTQTTYRSIFDKDDRKYNTSGLRHAVCPQKHFTIRLVQHANASSEIVWGAVVGLAERFTYIELLSYPLYIVRNHGATWNNLWWTLLLAAAGAPLAIWLARRAVRACVGRGAPSDIEPARLWLYELALVGFAGTALEELIHLIYAQAGIPLDGAFWIGFFGVILFANGVGVLLVLTCKRHMHSAWWAIVEFGIGWQMLLLLGAGFYVGPGALMLAALARPILAWRASRDGDDGGDLSPGEGAPLIAGGAPMQRVKRMGFRPVPRVPPLRSDGGRFILPRV
jgi:hypothetical protein